MVNARFEKFAARLKRESPDSLTFVTLFGLDGWPKTHAVRVCTWESYVPQCWQQKIATMIRRGRFINATRR